MTRYEPTTGSQAADVFRAVAWASASVMVGCAAVLVLVLTVHAVRFIGWPW